MLDYIYKIDFAVLDAINSIHFAILDRVFIFFTKLGNFGTIWIAVGILLLISKRCRKTGIILLIAVTVGTVISSGIIKPLAARPRPFEMREGISLLIKAPHDYSFPSGHTLASFISAVIIFRYHKKLGIFAFLLAFLIAFSRLYLYVHFPTDVLCGILFGVFVGVVSCMIYEKTVKKDDFGIQDKV